MKYEKWLEIVPKEMKEDISWRLEAYRLGLFLSDACWKDTEKIIQLKRFALADQLYRSVGSISANIIEGYSRISKKEKARFYEISLGSAREARDWYFKSRHAINYERAYSRIKLLTSIIKLLQRMISDQRLKSKNS
ncbi:four helix bundle protein [Gracilimonas sp.]|uniref:four helix bundle protein n=1 Tax=Gracilimonas sp. TaxID=1974203 RepID=UPI002871E400|nr:four helix bundle protein [Gracilimonas sp.]